MSTPAHSSLLDRALLDDRAYMQSLLTRALTLGMVDSAFIRSVRDELNLLLIRQCQAFTGGRSSSMRKSVVQSLGESMLFTLNAYLKELEPIDAMAALQHRSLERCYVEGRSRVDAQLRMAELSYLMEVRRPLVENDLLTSTFREGLRSFFNLYNPEYGAHEIHITADYPVLFYPQGYQGIEFIRQYLENFCLENRFLRLLEPHTLHRWLSAYALSNNTTLRDLCDNLYQIALACALTTYGNTPQLLTALRCDSPALTAYVHRTEKSCRTDLERIQAQLQNVLR